MHAFIIFYTALYLLRFVSGKLNEYVMLYIMLCYTLRKYIIYKRAQMVSKAESYALRT